LSIDLEVFPRELQNILFEDISEACMSTNICLIS
jgi:hypothetical protein